MDFNNMTIINSSKVKLTDKKILLEVYYTSEPLYRPTEVIAVYTKAKDKRAYSNLTIVVEPKASELTNYETLTKGLVDALDRGEYKELGENKSLFYATLEPTASLISKKRSKA